MKTTSASLAIVLLVVIANQLSVAQYDEDCRTAAKRICKDLISKEKKNRSFASYCILIGIDVCKKARAAARADHTNTGGCEHGIC